MTAPLAPRSPLLLCVKPFAAISTAVERHPFALFDRLPLLCARRNLLLDLQMQRAPHFVHQASQE